MYDEMEGHKLTVKDKNDSDDDLTRIYLDQIGRIPQLTPDQQTNIGARIESVRERIEQSSGSKEKVARLQEEIREAQNEVVAANLRFVVFIAKRYKNSGLAFLDLVQEGNIGLLKAVERFDFKRGFRPLLNYAERCIRQAILEKIRKESRHNEVSLQTPTEDGESELGELIEDKNATPPGVEDGEGFNLLGKRLVEVFEKLTDKERRVLELRFGVDGSAHTLREVGKEFDETRERIRQIEARGLRKGRVKRH